MKRLELINAPAVNGFLLAALVTVMGCTGAAGAEEEEEGSPGAGGTPGAGDVGGGESSGGGEGVPGGPSGGGPNGGGSPSTGVDPAVNLRLEAESASLTGVTVATDVSGYSGAGFVSGFDDGSDEVSFNVNVPSAGAYNLLVLAQVRTSMDSPKTNDIHVNGGKVGDFTVNNTGTWTDAFGDAISLDAGDNTVSIKNSWGYFELDYIEVSSPGGGDPGGGDPGGGDPGGGDPGGGDPTTESSVRLANPNASDGAKRLYKYLSDQYGRKIIAGQQDLSWRDSVNMVERVFRDTGKYPALQGFDFINFKNSGGDGTNQVGEAIEWWSSGGIVTFCWHWRDPRSASGDFYTNGTSYRIPYNASAGAWDTGDAYNKLIDDIDAVAEELAELEDAGVPVLWRPIHEASGGWFWWGASGAEPNKALWRLMFDRLTNHHGLNNLIWVWNGQNPGWYPGDDVVDLIGEDVYAGARNYGTQRDRFNTGESSSPSRSRMVAMTENGSMPDPDRLISEGVKWSWFMTWNDSTGAEGADSDSSFWTGQHHNENSHKRHVYSHDYVITKDELPDLTTYSLR